MDPTRSTRNCSFVYRVTVTVFCNIIVNFRALQMPVTTDKYPLPFSSNTTGSKWYKSSASAEVADRTLFTSALRRIFSNR